MIDLSVVIPIYRSENSIRELHQRLVDQLNKICIEFEIVFVEDCGGDNSWNIIKELVADDVRVCGMRMSRNYGQHNALLAGIRAARGNLIVTVDDDLQHPPEEIPDLLTELQKGFDVVYGFPQTEQHGFFRNIASQITKIALQKSMGAQTARHVSAFRVFKTELRDAFKDFTGPSVNIDVLLTWGAAKFSAIPVKHDERKYGASNYTTRKLIQHAINMVTGFSTIPLKIAGILGFFFSIFGILVLAYVLSQYLLHGSIVPGFAFIASIVAIFSGAQLFALGIMGEYLARIYQRTMERPAYVIRESV
ncbi:glycosyltransferase family 2 protein [Polynucleobacter sp. MWH-Svant-W18]|uniref:glycosyltransferase family 2 protein n=1 Tax=Polynucleobacter sp. MWH-Svant-W18 TaxID=1855909 RepID=UPI001BFD9F1E|nr:glycosyltransferase family 2 protein [Polynucleobacter sp. MWH-Svant-W18]QWD78308.1 glycosyltransferase family 2 protein [Polynucleobacter sp. MWH-Svant-W18]